MLGFALDRIFNPRLRGLSPVSINGFLQVQDLSLHFRTLQGIVQAVDDVSLTLGKGRTLAILASRAAGRAPLPRQSCGCSRGNVQAYRGRIVLDGLDTMSLPEERFRKEVRWTKIALVPQAAETALLTRWSRFPSRSPNRCSSTAGWGKKARRSSEPGKRPGWWASLPTFSSGILLS